MTLTETCTSESWDASGGIGGMQPNPRNRDASGMQPELPKYADVAGLLHGGIPDPPMPTVCRRTDGVPIFYPRQYNNVFGDPESGKTLLCDHATAEVLNDGGRVLRLDMDHNGVESTISRLIDFGASEDQLSDTARFLYVEPDDAMHMHHIVAHMETWRPTLVIIDSTGELMPLFGANSNDSDDFTRVHSTIIKPLVRTGAAVVGIDHLAKGADSRAYGPTGTAAKRRTIGGISLRVKVDQAFNPETGGSAWLTIHKDRHGGLRRASPVGDKEPIAGKFVILGDTVKVQAPNKGERNPAEAAPPEDVAAIAALDPPPTSARDARERLKWRDARSRTAFTEWKRTAA